MWAPLTFPSTETAISAPTQPKPKPVSARRSAADGRAAATGLPEPKSRITSETPAATSSAVPANSQPNSSHGTVEAGSGRCTPRAVVSIRLRSTVAAGAEHRGEQFRQALEEHGARERHRAGGARRGQPRTLHVRPERQHRCARRGDGTDRGRRVRPERFEVCLLYTSDAAD